MKYFSIVGPSLMKLYTTPLTILTLLTWVTQRKLAFGHSPRSWPTAPHSRNWLSPNVRMWAVHLDKDPKLRSSTIILDCPNGQSSKFTLVQPYFRRSENLKNLFSTDLYYGWYYSPFARNVKLHWFSQQGLHFTDHNCFLGFLTESKEPWKQVKAISQISL